jgi:hypothetical protein
VILSFENLNISINMNLYYHVIYMSLLKNEF